MQNQQMTEQHKTDQQIAEQCAAIMLENDEASKSKGLSIQAIGPGHATMAMIVTTKMLNGNKTCHGGSIFSLADSTFALACNSYNKTAVAAFCDISFVRPAHAGDKLTAIATEKYKAGRNGIYDVIITDQNGEIIALFHGKSRVISRTGPLDENETS